MTSADAIVRPGDFYVAPSWFPELGRIVQTVAPATKNTLCSAVLLSRSTAVTAAHCFDGLLPPGAADPDRWRDLRTSGVSLAFEYVPAAVSEGSAEARSVAISGVLLFPSYVRIGPADVRDLALVRLHTPIEDVSRGGCTRAQTEASCHSSVLPLDLDPPDVDAPAVIMGWGTTASGRDDHSKRAANAKVVQTHGTTLVWLDGPASACDGDAGGLVMLHKVHGHTVRNAALRAFQFLTGWLDGGELPVPAHTEWDEYFQLGMIVRSEAACDRSTLVLRLEPFRPWIEANVPDLGQWGSRGVAVTEPDPHVVEDEPAMIASDAAATCSPLDAIACAADPACAWCDEGGGAGDCRAATDVDVDLCPGSSVVSSGCATDDECASGEACIDGVCVSSLVQSEECADDWDCAGESVCLSGVCTDLGAS